MVHIDPALCTGCGRCADNCAVHAIVPRGDGTYRCNKTWCFACGQCVALCPAGAASMPELEPPIPYDSTGFDLDPQTLLNAMRFRRSIRHFTGREALPPGAGAAAGGGALRPHQHQQPDGGLRGAGPGV